MFACACLEFIKMSFIVVCPFCAEVLWESCENKQNCIETTWGYDGADDLASS